MIWEKGQVLELTPPHDVLTKKIRQYLPKTKCSAICRNEAMRSSKSIR